MNILVLDPRQAELRFALFSETQRGPVIAGTTDGARVRGDAAGALIAVQEQLAGDPASIEAVALRVAFGGPCFGSVAVADAEVIGQLRRLVAEAPLHLPTALALVSACGHVFPGVPVLLAFETGFFAALAPREHLYALDAELVREGKLRRYGYHGLHHESACAEAERKRRLAGQIGRARIMSICLEPRPEAAAVLGGRPLTVTGGATPLEGLMGETSCGEIDPSIVLMLTDKKGWGPEQLNTVLTRQSGLLALSGLPTTLADAATATDDRGRLAWEMFRYQLLRACGAGAAAMGGIDVLAFSGRYAALGESLGEWLRSRLTLKCASPIQVECFQETLARIVADRASAALLGAASPDAV